MTWHDDGGLPPVPKRPAPSPADEVADWLANVDRVFNLADDRRDDWERAREKLGQRPPATIRRTGTDGESLGTDPLKEIPPAEYVAVLTGESVPTHRKIRCPFHEERTPSFHVYPSPDKGWYCFACGKGGDIYTLAQLLLGEQDFRALRQELAARLLGGLYG